MAADTVYGKPRKKKGKEQTAPPAPDLSYIPEKLRPLAVPCDELKFHPKNARLHDEKSIRGLMGSLREFGQTKNIVVQKSTGYVVCGNGTLEAMRALGRTHIAADFQELTDARADELALADNATQDLSSWDTEILEQTLRGINTADQDLADMFTRLAEAEEIVPEEDDKDGGKDGESETPAGDKFCVLIDCTDEAQQTELLEKLTDEGYKCRALVA